MILELDLGNSLSKWRLLDAAGAVTARGVGDLQLWLAGTLPVAWGDDCTRVRIASVLAPAVERDLEARLRSWRPVSVGWASSTASCAGVHNGYAEPGRLGVDRWLAMIAAYREQAGAVLVADIGSALTLDLVDRAGSHRGGYIIPGPRLMADALLQSTDRVRFEQGAGLGALDLGLSTEACVGNGIAAALTGAVLLGCRRAESLLSGPVALLVAGGYGAELVSSLGAAGLAGAQWRPELVLDGLRWVVP